MYAQRISPGLISHMAQRVHDRLAVHSCSSSNAPLRACMICMYILQELLLEAGACPAAVDTASWTALHWAISDDSTSALEVVRTLMSTRPALARAETADGSTPLCIAFENNIPRVFCAIFDCPASSPHRLLPFVEEDVGSSALSVDRPRVVKPHPDIAERLARVKVMVH